MKKRRKEGPAPKRKRMPGRRFPVGAEGQGPPCVWGALGPRAPKKHKTKTKGGLTTGNGDLVWLMRDLFVIISLIVICTQSGHCWVALRGP